MKLYYFKAACSMAPHIVLEELGLPYEAVSMNILGETPPELLKANPLGVVPVLIMDNGEPLTEVAVILQYLADLKPEAGLAPRWGTLERVRLNEWLNFIATEVHKGFGPLWALDFMSQNPNARDDIRNFAVSSLGERFDIMSQKLGKKDYLMPHGYTIADAYLFTILSWTKFLKVDLSRWPMLQTYLDRVGKRPATIKTLKAEHLM
jgi:glutathione S-transferase